ncbi:esterase/lipase family protein [Kitasatospora viridis]|uniref:Triacylglycerol esterase/lipase EstA (Alpha/beta hydrolase family) n=1 Tax=Kitasatospora viridis TaxID=281105 RepID=A0A561UPL1_9ACTN|nr:alpha/beta fold hydrolase [Kitasatospora viridis]TWG01305.1 triacylglycerol esterase/lipase EstA (alpha/beta hydrolase family) [Kitasatospora viridis]
MRLHHSLALAATAVAGLLAATAGPAAAADDYPIDYHASSGFVAGFTTPEQAPPGADDPACRPSAAHPDPVVLVHGTFENRNDNWRAAAPLLADHGYCVYTFNYGGGSDGAWIQGTGPIEDGAAALAGFVDQVLAHTGAAKVDLVGHSQGGMMPRYYLKNLGGAAKVDQLIGLAPSNQGTTLDGLTALGTQLGLLEPANAFLSTVGCPACVEQEIGSPFMTALNAGGETVPGVRYTVIATVDDEVVTPYTNAFLPAGPDVTDITVQDQCALDATEHVEIAYDPIALTDVLNALDPAHPQPIPCQVVLPITGPLT